jgi:hypothetical protein
MKVAETLLSILSTNGSKSYTVGFVVPSGRPRYVNGIEATLHPNNPAMSCAELLLKLIGIKDDL